MKKSNWKVISACILCLLMLVMCCNLKPATYSVEADEDEITEARTAIIFKIIEGNGITVYRENVKEAAYEGMRLKGGDSIVTDEYSSVYFRVDDDKNILLGKDSKMNIEELSSGMLALRLEYGEFFFNVEKKLKIDEQMEFRIGQSTMSIRGTSGAGELREGQGEFAIYTGRGALNNVEEPDVEYSIMPSTIAHFEEANPAETVELKVLEDEEVSPLLEEYVTENEEYKEELEERGWGIEEETVAPSDIDIPEIIEDKAIAESYNGWEQLEDASWKFSKENFRNGVGPVYYKKDDTVLANKELKLTGVEKKTIADNSSVTFKSANKDIVSDDSISETSVNQVNSNDTIDDAAGIVSVAGESNNNQFKKTDKLVNPRISELTNDSVLMENINTTSLVVNPNTSESTETDENTTSTVATPLVIDANEQLNTSRSVEISNSSTLLIKTESESIRFMSQ